MPNPNLFFATALASALADLGIEHACLSPGSRNTPLIAGFAAEPRIRKWPVIDERSAGFFGVGLARATQRPVALVCTSGTAAAEYHPAVIEASQSDVPLLILTADRPAELRNIGSPQTIDQLGLFGSSVRQFLDVPAPDGTTTSNAVVHLARRARTAAAFGPVHLNLQFREPLLGDPVVTPNPPAEPTIPTPHLVDDLDEVVATLSRRKGLIIAGQSYDPEFPAACTALAAATGFPIIADPLSGLRHGTHQLDLVLANGDTLAAAGFLSTLTPDLVIRLGPIPTSKPVQTWLETHPDVEQVLAETAGRDATKSATRVLTLPPTIAARALTSISTKPAPPEWTARWRELDKAAAEAIDTALGRAEFPNEPAIARIVLENSPVGAFVTVGSSMPIRDVDTYGGKSSLPIRVFGNRGTNGIDGIVSSALGTTVAGPGVVLVGDVSMFHDINALGTAAQLGLPITIVVVNNDGGGIFHFLPQNDPTLMDPATFETYLGTPHGTDFAGIATAIGLVAHDVSDAAELARLISNPTDGPRLIQIRTDREENLRFHRSITDAVHNSLA